MSYLKAENLKLKKKIQQLEDRVLDLEGSIKILSSVTENNEHVINNQIADIITSASELKIVAPYITKEYTLVLQDRVKSGADVMLVLNDRRLWPDDAATFYDKIKVTPNMELVNNPNVKYLMVWS